MFLIILHHIGMHGLTITNDLFSYNYIYKSFLSIVGKIGVNVFVIISAYFMITGKFNIKKYFKLFGQVLFYSLGIFLIVEIFLKNDLYVGLSQISKSLFPVLSSHYWFITDYQLFD